MMKEVTEVAVFCLLLHVVIANYSTYGISSCSHSDYIKKVGASIASTINFLQQDDNTLQVEINSITPILFGLLPSVPASSCLQISLYPSGYYWVRASNGSAVHVYCDMTTSCGEVTEGWMRVAELDMTNSSHQCPSGLKLHVHTDGKRICVPNNDSPTCSSVTFQVNSNYYSDVCGRIIGYQYSSTNAFGFRRNIFHNIDTYYVDGVSLTHGNPRQHIWTFAAAYGETSNSDYICPCTNTNKAGSAIPSPEFVGNDYFCDTGSSNYSVSIFYLDDPLWDGAGCGPLSTCCSFNNPPWFHKQLPQSTTDNIEMRVCRDQDSLNEDIALETIHLFVK